MYRLGVLFGVAILLFTAVLPGFCQGIPGCYPQPFPTINPCAPTRPTPPISRTVRADVPVPYGPPPCGSVPPNLCAPPSCAPLPPTRPVQVRVDVVVRSETPKPCAPQRFCCENPPVFEPFFCQGAALVQSLLAAPLALGERLMGHRVPVCIPSPQCPPPAYCPGFVPPPCISKCRQPVVQCAPNSQRPRFTAPMRPHASYGPLPR
jgi:hypothetical protein